MDWECGDLDATVPAATKVCKWLLPPSELRDGYTDPTLMATMVWLAIEMSPATADVNSVAGLGIIVVSAFSDADPVGDACPGPLTDCSADWVWLYYAPVAVLAGRGAVYSGNDFHDRVSKARRRLGNDKAILLVGESIGITAATHMHVRCLIKE